MKVTMTYKKSTKGTHVYEDSDENTVLTQLYLKRVPLEAAFGGQHPVVITVTIEEEK